jgi:hypothetical protein
MLQIGSKYEMSIPVSITATTTPLPVKLTWSALIADLLTSRAYIEGTELQIKRLENTRMPKKGSLRGIRIVSIT